MGHLPFGLVWVDDGESARWLAHYEADDHYYDCPAGDGRVYLVGADRGPLKIGYTAGVPSKRLGDLQTGSPFKLRVYATAPGDKEDEKALHKGLRKHWLRGEWFDRMPAAKAFKAYMTGELVNVAVVFDVDPATMFRDYAYDHVEPHHLQALTIEERTSLCGQHVEYV